MRIRNSLFRSAVIILSVAALATQLSACGSQIVRPKGSSSEAKETETPKLASEIFAEGANNALFEAVEKSERLGSVQLSLLLNPGAQLNETQSNYTKSSLTLINTEDESGNIVMSVESSLDAATGDSAMVASVQAGNEVAQSSGVYFTGNTMLIKKANAEKPMIQHTLDPSVAESFKSLSSIERFMRVLSDTTKPKMTDEEWSKAIEAFLQSVTASAQETNYVSEQQAVTVAGTSQDCTSTTLTLSGENAISAVRGMATLISLDPSFKAFFISQYLLDEETYGVTGMDGVLRDLDAMTPEERNEMTLTFKTLQGEKTSAVYLSAVTGAKTMSILFKFFEDGYARENDIVFTGFDGSSVKMNETNVSTGGDNYTGQIIFDDIAPGGVLQEHSEIATTSAITENSFAANVQFKYSRVATPSMSAMEFGAALDYSQQESAQGTSGSSTGTISIISEGETQTLNVSMSLEQLDSPPPITVPQFIPTAGISTSDQTGIYNALLGDSEGAPNTDAFNLAPMTGRMMAAFALVLI